MGDELLFLKLVETEAIASLHVVVVVLNVGDDPWRHLQLHILRRRVLLLVLVHRLEVLPNHRPVRNDVGREIIRQRGKKHARHHVRPQQALERDSGREHGYDLRVARELSGEKDDRDEDEQRAEEVGEVRDEVGVVIEHYGAQWRMVFGELRQVLIDIEDDGYGDNQGYGEEICPDKLLDDVPIYPLDITEDVEISQHSQEAKPPANPFEYPLKQARVVGCPPEEAMQPFRVPRHPSSSLVESAMLPYLTETLHT